MWTGPTFSGDWGHYPLKLRFVKAVSLLTTRELWIEVFTPFLRKKIAMVVRESALYG